MNKTALRELFGELRADMRDYFDAQRDALNAQAKMAERVFDLYAELIPGPADTDAPGKFAEGAGVDVVRPPAGTAHAWNANGKCVVHPGCDAKDPEAETPTPTVINVTWRLGDTYCCRKCGAGPFPEADPIGGKCPECGLGAVPEAS